VNAEDLLEHFAILKGIAGRRARKEVVEALLRQTNLWDVRKQKLGGYSEACGSGLAWPWRSWAIRS
jgi:ABC-type multidrug transport system, ATPase component